MVKYLLMNVSDNCFVKHFVKYFAHGHHSNVSYHYLAQITSKAKYHIAVTVMKTQTNTAIVFHLPPLIWNHRCGIIEEIAQIP